MALGKVRTNKRSSGTSYTSTVTTLVFVALCVLGVWMLTSNSVVPPQTTTRAATTTATASDHAKFISKRDTPIYEDTPGDLPEDAIKTDEPIKIEDTTINDQSQDDQQNASLENSAETETETETNNDEKQETEPEPENNVAENNREETEQENGGGDTKSEEDNVLKQPGSEVHDENPQGSEVKEPSEEVSDESSASRNQQSDESTSLENQNLSAHESSEDVENQKMRDDQGSKVVEENQTHEESKVAEENQIHEESKAVEENLTHEETEENDKSSQYTHHHHVSEEDQHKQLEQQRRGHKHGQGKGQHEEKSEEELHGETSHDQIEHDEAPIQSIASNEDQSSQQTTHDPNPQVEHQETKRTEEKPVDTNSNDSFPGGENSGIPKESKESKQSWKTQADQSENQKERRKGGSDGQEESIYGYTWQLCNVTAGQDYIPCLDNEKAIRQLHGRKHYEHRERHCPEEPPTCLVPMPEGYKRPVPWPQSRDKIWYHNVPHTLLAEVKGHQNWVKLTGEFLTFPGGGTQFIHGALHYIDFIQEAEPAIAWGVHTRVVLDVGCGVASFGGYLFDRDVLAISFAPKDEHEAQVQFALERGIPAISAVMGTQRLPFPSRVFDLVHCARCRVPWHAEGGALLLELNRVLRPGGYFVWSATPVYQTLEEDVQIWKEMTALTIAMCWDLVTIKKDKLNSVGAAIYRKPTSNECYDQRKHNQPPMCKNDDDPNAAWYVPLQACMHQVPVNEAERGARWPEAWPTRLQTPPYWLNRSQTGIYGKLAPEDFLSDYNHWKRVVKKSYLSGLGISWANVRNIMDMRAVYGGFAAAMKDLGVWVLNVVNIDSPDTLPIIYERGLFGIYHDWCESFSTYPRTYDLLHADHLFSMLKKRCKIIHVMTEIDRIVRPGGKLIVRDESSTVGEVENLLKSLHWEVHLTFSKNQEGILSAQKSDWRPDSYAASS